MSTDLAYSEWTGFLLKLEAAEEEFVRGRPAAFQALWSHSDDVTLCGAFGGVARGWQNLTPRLNGVSAKYSDGTRTREEIASMVGVDFAYLIQTENIRSKMASQNKQSIQKLRATMVFRYEKDGWRITPRHADLHVDTQPPR
jgi:ketosteroid isomerase-like protein